LLKTHIYGINASMRKILRSSHEAVVFAGKFDVNIFADIQDDHRRMPQLGADEADEALHHIERAGADYRLARIDYVHVRQTDKLLASRTVACIRPGERTELAYWPAAAAVRQLSVHRGLGQLLIARPGSVQLESLELDADSGSHREIPLVPDRFYTIQASEFSQEMLVVSHIEEYDPDAAWQYEEVPFSPDAAGITAEGHALPVPAAFTGLFRD
jgi:hypothetical protein